MTIPGNKADLNTTNFTQAAIATNISIIIWTDWQEWQAFKYTDIYIELLVIDRSKTPKGWVKLCPPGPVSTART